MTESERISEALRVILHYGGIDGNHHKQWTLDQVVRVLTGCELERKVAVGADGKEYPYFRRGRSSWYDRWVENHNDGEDGPNTYSWDEGIPP